MSPVRVLDLFCGAGGSSYGAQAAGAEIVAGIDVWEPAIKTFRANFPNAVAKQIDLKFAKPTTIKKQLGEIDLILASPECTSHSNARGGQTDSENSRRTAFHILKFAAIFTPKWIVIENVLEMKDWSGYATFLRKLRRFYKVRDDVVLNAKDFGVPQSRERLFILCQRGSTPPKISSPKLQPVPVSTVISNNTYTFSPLRKRNRAEATIQRAENAIAELGQNEPFLVVYYGSNKSGKGSWQALDEPLRTITTLDRFGLVQPQVGGHQLRMLQPEELKLAMGYDVDFVLDGVEGLTRRERVKLMGNGVCPPVMKGIVEGLIRTESDGQ